MRTNDHRLRIASACLCNNSNINLLIYG